MGRIGRWFAVKMIEQTWWESFGCQGFPLTSALRTATIYLRRLWVSGGKRKNLLPQPTLCLFVHPITQQDVTILKFHSVNKFPKNYGKARTRKTQLSCKASPIESQCRAADQLGFFAYQGRGCDLFRLSLVIKIRLPSMLGQSHLVMVLGQGCRRKL